MSLLLRASLGVSAADPRGEGEEPRLGDITSGSLKGRCRRPLFSRSAPPHQQGLFVAVQSREGKGSHDFGASSCSPKGLLSAAAKEKEKETRDKNKQNIRKLQGNSGGKPMGANKQEMGNQLNLYKLYFVGKPRLTQLP